MRRIGKQRVHLGEHLAIAVVETTGDSARKLDVGQLVAADGDHVALAEQDVARLMDRIGQKEAGKSVT